MISPPQTPAASATNVVVVPLTAIVTFTVAPAAAAPPICTLPFPDIRPPDGTVTVGGGGAPGSAAVNTSAVENPLACTPAVCRAASWCAPLARVTVRVNVPPTAIAGATKPSRSRVGVHPADRSAPVPSQISRAAVGVAPRPVISTVTLPPLLDTIRAAASAGLPGGPPAPQPGDVQIRVAARAAPGGDAASKPGVASTWSRTSTANAPSEK